MLHQAIDPIELAVLQPPEDVLEPIGAPAEVRGVPPDDLAAVFATAQRVTAAALDPSGLAAEGANLFQTNGVSGSSFLSYNSTGSAVAEAGWNNLASPVTGQLTVQAAVGGLQVSGPAPLAQNP